MAGTLSLVLLAAPLLLLRNSTAPSRGTVLASAGAADAQLALRHFAPRAGRFAIAARPVAIASITPTSVIVVTPPPTAPPATAPPATAARRVIAAVRPTTTTTSRPRPRPTTTTSSSTTTTAAPVPAHSESGEASWYYGPDGECAHNRAPIGSIIRVTNLDNGKSTTCRVAGRGPYGDGRIVDLTKSTFARVASVGAGVFHARVDW